LVVGGAVVTGDGDVVVAGDCGLLGLLVDPQPAAAMVTVATQAMIAMR
jgi:hypothetical protein